MQVTSVSDFRRDTKKYIDAVDQNHEPLIITRSDNVSVVMIPLDDYNAITETDYLLGNPLTRARLEESIDQLKSGEVISKTLEELKAYE